MMLFADIGNFGDPQRCLAVKAKDDFLGKLGGRGIRSIGCQIPFNFTPCILIKIHGVAEMVFTVIYNPPPRFGRQKLWLVGKMASAALVEVEGVIYRVYVFLIMMTTVVVMSVSTFMVILRIIGGAICCQ